MKKEEFNVRSILNARQNRNLLHTNKQNNNANVGSACYETPNGITIISLVITIIILLILAGVTISLMLGDEGIFRLAQNAGKNYIDVAELEKDAIANYENKILGYVDGTRQNAKINYSVEEQATGITWLDGKTIYQKTIICEYPNGANSEKLYDLSNLNIDKVISIYGIAQFRANGNSVHSLPYIYSSNEGTLGASEEIIYIYDTKKLRIRSAIQDMSGNIAYITIQYTKF